MIDLGDTHRVTVAIRGPDGQPATPTAATVTIALPDGTTITPPAVITPGLVTCDYATTQPGRHALVVTTTGPTTAFRDVFDVRTPETIAIIGLADARAQLNITGNSHDEELRSFIEAATFVVESKAGATVLRERVETVEADGIATLTWRPIDAITAVETERGDTAYPPANLAADEHGVLRLRSGAPLRGRLRVTYRAGHASIPPNRSLAARIIVQHLWETQRIRDPRRIRVPSADETFVQSTEGRWFSVPRKALELLEGEAVGGFA